MCCYFVFVIVLVLVGVLMVLFVVIVKVLLMCEVIIQLLCGVVLMYYDVVVVLYVDKFVFDGKVMIMLNVFKFINSIMFNVVDFMFFEVLLMLIKLKIMVGKLKVMVDEKVQMVIFIFDYLVLVGEYCLVMIYIGKIGIQVNGIFVLDYDIKVGKKCVLYMQFENFDVCCFIFLWDELNYKVIFNFIVIVLSVDMVVSNMFIVLKKDLGNGMIEVYFGQLLKMFIYLLFFSVGEFECVIKMVEGIEIGVIVQKGMVDQVDFVLELFVVVLYEYNDYFGVKYLLLKLDNIVVLGQSQFFLVMENWGVIFIFEYFLLFNFIIFIQGDKQCVFNIVVYEMVYQWFGDLVMMSWWDDLWFNEGFVLWMVECIIEKLYLEWYINFDLVGMCEGVMLFDVVVIMYLVVQYVEMVEQVSQVFDLIIYFKGQVVIIMFEVYVGLEIWCIGVCNYIKVYVYGNMVFDDLWKLVQVVVGKLIIQIVYDFMLQLGILLICVQIIVCNVGKIEVLLSQGEFIKDCLNKKVLCWYVLVIVKIFDGKLVIIVVDGKGLVIVLGCGLVLVNVGQIGYYCMLYLLQQFVVLKGDFVKLVLIDQFGLMGDIWVLVMVGQELVVNVLELVKVILVDVDLQVWGEVVGYFSVIDSYYKGDEVCQICFCVFVLE